MQPNAAVATPGSDSAPEPAGPQDAVRPRVPEAPMARHTARDSHLRLPPVHLTTQFLRQPRLSAPQTTRSVSRSVTGAQNRVDRHTPRTHGSGVPVSSLPNSRSLLAAAASA